MAYDAWLCTDPSYERACAVESLIESDDHLSALQRWADNAAARVAAIEKRLATEPAGGYRVRALLTLRWAKAVANSRATNLQTAIEEWGDDEDPPDRDDDR